jgi:hypothetical protein
MSFSTERRFVDGPAGMIECAISSPGLVRGMAVVCHPHPLHGGTMDNKVVMTISRALLQDGLRVVRFNFRGIGGSEGTWGEGSGEIDDAMAVIASLHDESHPLVLGGFSFGGYVAANAAARLAPRAPAKRLVLVAPAVQNFQTPPVPPDTLVVHGEADDVVPLDAVLAWARPQVLPVTVVPDTGHFFHGRLPLLKQLIAGHMH